jgi:hypothetical protein
LNTDEDVRNTQKNWTVHLWIIDAEGNPSGASVNDFIDVTLNGWAMRRVGVEAILCFAIKRNFLTQEEGMEVHLWSEHPVLGWDVGVNVLSNDEGNGRGWEGKVRVSQEREGRRGWQIAHGLVLKMKGLEEDGSSGDERILGKIKGRDILYKPGYT